MNRKLLAVLAVAALAATPAIASAQASTSVSLAAGLAIPSGTGSDQIDNGYNIAAGLNIGMPLMPVGFRLEGGYNAFKAKGSTSTNSADSRIMSGTANVTAGLGLPYLIGGVGYYNAKTSFTSGGITASDPSSSAFGLNGGVGLRFPLGTISTFAEVRYHKMMGDIDGAYIPITFGINF